MQKYEFGDYLRYQIDQQMYPFLGQLNEVLDGSLDPEAVDLYQHWMSDPDQASVYSEARSTRAHSVREEPWHGLSTSARP